MTRNWRFKSVRTRQVFWFLTVAMAPLFAVVIILYFQRAEVIKGREFEKLQTIRDLQVRELNGWLDERMGDLELAAGDHATRSLESVLAADRETWTREDMEAVATVRQTLQRYVDSYDAYQELFIISAHSGEVMISSAASREKHHNRRDSSLIEVLRTKQPYIKDIYHSKTDGRPAMTVSAPVFCLDHEGEHLFGVVVAQIDLEHSLYPLLQENTGAGETGETLIVNSDAMALNDLRWHANAPLNLKIFAEPAVRAARGETGIAETADYRGEMVLAAYSHIPRTKWGFVAKRDLAEIYAPIRAMVRDMAIMLAVAASIVLFAALFLGRIVARPIVAIAKAAERIRGGDLTSRCEVEGADEVAQLAASFNDMTDTIASQLWVQQAGTDIANTAVAATTIADFASALTATLMRLTGSNIGAFYERSQDGSTFQRLTSVGLNADAPQAFDADSREGEFGEALARQSICYTSNISAETIFTFKAVTGTAMPREIVTIPLIVGRRCRAVVSLATLGEYTDDHRQILEQAWIGLHTVLSNLVASEATTHMAGELQTANEELQANNEELQLQAEEIDTQRAQVEQANRLKSEFLSNMSHELRTPLNSVLALSQLMISRGLGVDLEQESEYLRVIERNGRQLLGLINDILDLSKIEAGQQEVFLADVDPGEVAAAALATVEPLAREKRLTATLRAPDDLPAIHSDGDKLRQILLNLLSNAVKFTQTGHVALAVARTADGVAFAVTDTGPGIAPADLAHIFDEFRQLDGSTTRLHGGIGLGLSISRRLARLLGGDVAVTSERGVGSTFTLTLPLRCPAVRAGQAVAALTRPQPARTHRATFPGRPHILVVEDDTIAAIQIRTALEDHDCEVTVAAGGAEGVEAVRERVPDALVLDLMMPGIDGFAVLEQIRSIPTAGRLPVLVLTAKQLTAEDRSRLRYNNVQELVQKGSLNRDELIERIAGLLATHAGAEPADPDTGRLPVAKAPRAGTTILIVEDDPDTLLTITALLDEMGVGHAAAGDGKQAVQMAKETRPDLILMDIQLPVLSGLEATRQIKADPELRHIPIIALTARAMAGDREKILAAGCDDYVAKPMDRAAFGETIRRWLG